MFASASTIAWPRRQWQLLGGVLAIAILCAAVVYTSKAARNASAILRWRELILSVTRGENVYNEWTKDGSFPYPPVVGLLLWPLTQLAPLPSALTWFCMKLVMAGVAIRWSMQLTKPDEQFLPWQATLLVVLASRPLLGDLQHGNVNILILFLATAGLVAFQRNRDSIAGILIALAAAIKVTPLLFIPYFALKRQWRVVGWSMVALGMFLFLIPGSVLGFDRNAWLLRSWFGAMVEPYVVHGQVETLQTNQSIPGVLFRLTTDNPGIEHGDGRTQQINWISLPPETALTIAKAISLAIMAWVGWLSRAPVTDRRNARLASEYAMVFVAMLLVSERSWKHHFVTMTLPFAVLVAHTHRWPCSIALRRMVWTCIVTAFVLMASTSSELGSWLAGDGGHKLAQGYGMFCASAIVVLFALSALHLAAANSAPRESPFQESDVICALGTSFQPSAVSDQCSEEDN